MSARERLSAVLDRLLPAVDELGAAGELGLADVALADPLLEAAPGALERVLGALPAGFEQLDGPARDDALRRVEAAWPEEFAILISVAYNAYYSDGRVLARIGRLTAYKAGAPQPGGYEIEPFDESLLARIREREPFWRKVEP